MSSKILQLAVGSRDLSHTEKKIHNYLQSGVNSHNGNSKRSWAKKVAILSEMSCHFVHLLSFAKNCFILSSR